MVKRISSIALKGIALAVCVAVIVLSTLSSLAIGSAITLLGLGWPHWRLNQCKGKNLNPSLDINNIPDDALLLL